MCFARPEDALVGSQHSLSTPTSLPPDQVVGNPLSLYSSYLALQAQHAPSAHDETIIQALKNIQDAQGERGAATALTLRWWDPLTFRVGGRQRARAQDISTHDKDDEAYNSLGCLRPHRSL
jgi:hypothetical protein